MSRHRNISILFYSRGMPVLIHKPIAAIYKHMNDIQANINTCEKLHILQNGNLTSGH